MFWLLLYLSGSLGAFGMLITYPPINAGSFRHYATIGASVVFLGPIAAIYAVVVGIIVSIGALLD